jgi:hypothetical protein
LSSFSSGDTSSGGSIFGDFISCYLHNTKDRHSYGYRSVIEGDYFASYRITIFQMNLGSKRETDYKDQDERKKK